MAAVCEVCGKKPSFGMNISHSHRRTKRRWDPNIQKVRALVDGSQRRLVRRWEWLTLIPNDGFLPQTSHTAAMTLRLPRRILWVGRKG